MSESVSKLSLGDIKPFVSVLVARSKVGLSAGHWLTRLEKEADVRAEGATVIARYQGDNNEIRCVHYEREQTVAWHKSRTEPAQHLLAVVLTDRLLAIYASEARARSKLGGRLVDSQIKDLSAIPANEIERALVSGTAKLMWLQRVHRQDLWRPDSQVLSARDVNSTLDPLAHQSYRYSGVRLRHASFNSLGVSLDASRVWRGRSGGGEDFATQAVALLAAIKQAAAAADGGPTDAAETPTPFPALAAATGKLDDAETAIEAVLMPAETDVFIGQSDDDTVTGANLALKSVIAITATDGASFDAEVLCDGTALGSVEVTPTESSGRVTVAVKRTPAKKAGDEDDLLDEAVEWMRKPYGLIVHYETGHTLVGGRLAVVRYRDDELPQRCWTWSEFAGRDLGEEKPPKYGTKKCADPAQAIEGCQDSLFGWVFRELRSSLDGDDGKGWLLCDDRAMETCDFLYLDDDFDIDNNGAPRLVAVHVKGADRPSPKEDKDGVKKAGKKPLKTPVSANREVATNPFELVVGQAVKNLRHLDAVLNRATLEEFKVYLGHDAGDDADDRRPVWHGTGRVTLKEMLDRIDEVKSKIERHVVIVQPHQRKSLLGEELSGKQALRRKQLHTLLLAARASCASVGAEFHVISHDDSPPSNTDGHADAQSTGAGS